MLHPKTCCMFGYTGKESILRFKRDLLMITSASRRHRRCCHNPNPNPPNYEIDAIHYVNIKNPAVVTEFNCLILGKEGRGTDIMKFHKDHWYVVPVEAIRHPHFEINRNIDWTMNDSNSSNNTNTQDR